MNNFDRLVLQLLAATKLGRWDLAELFLAAYVRLLDSASARG
jgi:hypothetical protein